MRVAAAASTAEAMATTTTIENRFSETLCALRSIYFQFTSFRVLFTIIFCGIHIFRSFDEKVKIYTHLCEWVRASTRAHIHSHITPVLRSIWFVHVFAFYVRECARVYTCGFILSDYILGSESHSVKTTKNENIVVVMCVCVCMFVCFHFISIVLLEFAISRKKKKENMCTLFGFFSLFLLISSLSLSLCVFFLFNFFFILCIVHNSVLSVCVCVCRRWCADLFCFAFSIITFFVCLHYFFASIWHLIVTLFVFSFWLW